MTSRAPLLISFLVVTTAIAAGVSCSKKVEELPPSDFTASSSKPLPPGPDTLEKVDEVVGTGPEAKTGDKVKVHYTGTLMNGKQFDSSVGKDPFEFTLGQGGVIKGWDEGVPGMHVGGKRKLTIPWKLAYGEAGSGEKIPPKAALKFDIELLEIVGDTPDGGAKKDTAANAKKPDAKKPEHPKPAEK
jgi:FKBP-type peptidyl-prolyl cis-trans isomerase FkpA